MNPHLYKYYDNVPDEWRFIQLGEIGFISKGKGISKGQVVSNGKPCVLYGQLYTKYKTLIKDIDSFIPENVVDGTIVFKGDILLPSSGETREEIGQCATYLGDEPLFAGGDLIIFRPNKVADSLYLSYCINSIPLVYQKWSMAQGHSVVHLYGSHVNKLEILLPPLPEQKKIAQILSTWDKAIELLEKKIALKEELKKGLMQQLLTGKKRFKEFGPEAKNGELPQGWREVRLGDVFERITRKNTSGCTNVLTISGKQGLINQEKYFKKQVASTSLSGYYLLKKGEFAYNKSTSNGYPMGAIKRLERYPEGVVSTLYICFGLRTTEYSSNYLVQYFEAGMLVRELQLVTQEGARNHGLLNIGIDDFFSCKLILPEIAEQNKIAEVLVKADAGIELLIQKLTSLREQKKGLMQQLLTGKLRVKVA